MVILDYRDARPIYTQISDGIRDQILKGILCKGDKLPSVRELATQLTINPNTIQRSYRELEMQGWIASVPGKGSFVCGVPTGAVPEQEELLRDFATLVQRRQYLCITRQERARRLEQGCNASGL